MDSSYVLDNSSITLVPRQDNESHLDQDFPVEASFREETQKKARIVKKSEPVPEKEAPIKKWKPQP